MQKGHRLGMEVNLVPPQWATHLLSDLTDWQRAPVPVVELQPFTLPDDTYFEYAYLDASGTPRPDPDNDNPSRNPWWEFARSICGPDYRPDPFAEVGTKRFRGQLLRLTCVSRLLGQERRYFIYTPARHAESELPLVLFQDGKAYYGWGKVPQVFDRLLAAGQVRPAHLVFVPPRMRTSEYAFNATYRRFLTEERLPCVEGRIHCNGERIAWGASLGGLLSALLAYEHPELFRTVVAQSGTVLFSPDQDMAAGPFQGGEWFLREAAPDRLRRVRWYLDCGRLEWLLDSNRRLAAALEESGCAREYRERNAGHNWVNWRNGLASAFRFALARIVQEGGTADG